MTSINRDALYTFKETKHCLNTLFINVDFKDTDRLNFSFEINQACPLLEEHFPKFPVVPASLILGFLTEVNQSDQKPKNHLSVENIRFNLPMTPGKRYHCQFKNQASQSVMFTISDEYKSVYTRGIICNSNQQSTVQPKGEIHHAA